MIFYENVTDDLSASLILLGRLSYWSEEAVKLHGYYPTPNDRIRYAIALAQWQAAQDEARRVELL